MNLEEKIKTFLADASLDIIERSKELLDENGEPIKGYAHIYWKMTGMAEAYSVALRQVNEYFTRLRNL